MQLSADQLRDFDEQGYLFFPNCFSEEEIALLRDDAEAILKLDRQEVWREKTGAPRTAFAAHTFNETFRLLASHPRLVEPLRQLFGEDVYVHQFKLNAKAAFEGDVWQWHQDYGTWARDDGMPQARAMNIAVFLDEVMPINGALMLISKSHKQGVLKAGHDVETTSYPLWTLDKETVTQLASEGHGAASGEVAERDLAGVPGECRALEDVRDQQPCVEIGAWLVGLAWRMASCFPSARGAKIVGRRSVGEPARQGGTMLHVSRLHGQPLGRTLLSSNRTPRPRSNSRPPMRDPVAEDR